MKSLLILTVSLVGMNSYSAPKDLPTLNCVVSAVAGSFVAQQISVGQTFSLDLRQPSFKPEFKDGEKTITINPKTSTLTAFDINNDESLVSYSSYDRNGSTLMEKYRNGVTGFTAFIGNRPAWAAVLVEGHPTATYNSDHDINIDIDGTVNLDCKKP